MTQEKKKLLIKDLCARLPYGVKFNFGNYDGCDYKVEIISPVAINNSFPIEDCKPYLRPMSSMTEEEKYTYRHMLGATLNSEGESIMFVYVEDFPTVIDWLLSRHFDYRDLIEMDLALEAKEGIYKTD